MDTPKANLPNLVVQTQLNSMFDSSDEDLDILKSRKQIKV